VSEVQSGICRWITHAQALRLMTTGWWAALDGFDTQYGSLDRLGGFPLDYASL